MSHTTLSICVYKDLYDRNSEALHGGGAEVPSLEFTDSTGYGSRIATEPLANPATEPMDHELL